MESLKKNFYIKNLLESVSQTLNDEGTAETRGNDSIAESGSNHSTAERGMNTERDQTGSSERVLAQNTSDADTAEGILDSASVVPHGVYSTPSPSQSSAAVSDSHSRESRRKLPFVNRRSKGPSNDDEDHERKRFHLKPWKHPGRAEVQDDDDGGEIGIGARRKIPFIHRKSQGQRTDGDDANESDERRTRSLNPWKNRKGQQGHDEDEDTQHKKLTLKPWKSKDKKL